MTILLLLAFLPLLTYTLYEMMVLIREFYSYGQSIGTWDKEAIQGFIDQIRNPFIRMEVIRQFVRLANMPFAFTTIACAYWALHKPAADSKSSDQ